MISRWNEACVGCCRCDAPMVLYEVDESIDFDVNAAVVGDDQHVCVEM